MSKFFLKIEKFQKESQQQTNRSQNKAQNNTSKNAVATSETPIPIETADVAEPDVLSESSGPKKSDISASVSSTLEKLILFPSESHQISNLDLYEASTGSANACNLSLDEGQLQSEATAKTNSTGFFLIMSLCVGFKKKFIKKNIERLFWTRCINFNLKKYQYQYQ